MIPYFQYNAFVLGPITIQVWGLWVSLGIMAATFLQTRLARKYLLSEVVVLDATIWCLVSAFLFSRVFHVLFYHLDYYLLHPIDVLKFWQGGLSSLGGFFGALLALWLFAKKRKFTTWAEFAPYFDVMALGLWLGWGIGRIGCFLIHDHPGTLTHSVLGVKDYYGGTRHDLGLYESILGFVLFGIFALLFKRLFKIRSGLVAILSSLGYAVTRFFLDFLRATDLPGSDVRYYNLTPAQWGMLFVIFTLTFMLVFGKINPFNNRKINN